VCAHCARNAAPGSPVGRTWRMPCGQLALARTRRARAMNPTPEARCQASPPADLLADALLGVKNATAPP
jgi:hypothetical protein